MFVIGILSWWYSRGLVLRVTRVREGLLGLMDYFSIDLLLRTFFAPFRQISAGKVRGPLAVQMRAFFDRLVSRMIGAMVRLVMIVVGCFALIFYGVFGAVIMALWLVVPFLPIIGLALWMMGWAPWKI